jgi:DNA-binding transcriptional ArsR family regulator
MSRKSHSGTARRPAYASVFAAMGDKTRLSLIAQLCGGQPRSISRLREGSNLTRQAITKHLRVLERAEIVHSVRTGRESRFELNPQAIEGMKKYLDFVSEQWDRALSRLKSFVERADSPAERPQALPNAASQAKPRGGARNNKRAGPAETGR